jgi:hypothetical protein
LARHKGGSLESVVAADRRRNLLLSFGVLLLLAVSMALIIVSTQRARRLARLQMEFVAGVSHELRTPVAVICSAADNLAEGFVGAKDQVKEYGALIRNEGRRLAGMIEQILRFAAGQSRQASYDLGPVPVSEAVARVLANISALPEAEGFTVEREIDPDLPPVHADARRSPLPGEPDPERLEIRRRGALGAGARREHGRRVARAHQRGRSRETASIRRTCRTFSSRFYRGKSAQAAQIHGAGLGLSLARDIAEGMGGRLEASSEPGRGSTFTLELPRRPAAVRSPRYPRHNPRHNMERRILLVEDEPGLVMTLGDRLRSEGHRVESAADGQTGLRHGVRRGLRSDRPGRHAAAQERHGRMPRSAAAGRLDAHPDADGARANGR